MDRLTRSLAFGIGLASLGLLGQTAEAQRMSGEQLIRALQDGGYVIVMNQAHAEIPQAAGEGRGGRGGFGGGGRGGRGSGGGGGGGGRGGAPERDPVPMLTTDSQNMLIGTRHAIWYFEIPIAAVYTSPVPAAVQEAGEVPFAEISEVAGLSDSSADSGWLAAKLREAPMAGENSIVVTHAANIQADLGLGNLADGEAIIVRPGSSPAVVGRLGLREWSVLSIDLEP
jgi:hypothetical protein